MTRGAASTSAANQSRWQPTPSTLPSHPVWQRGGEEQRLYRGGVHTSVQDLLHVIHKAHVEHLIALVQHPELELAARSEGARQAAKLCEELVPPAAGLQAPAPAGGNSTAQCGFRSPAAGAPAPRPAHLRSRVPRSRWSFTRPGVPITTSTPRRRMFSCRMGAGVGQLRHALVQAAVLCAHTTAGRLQPSTRCSSHGCSTALRHSCWELSAAPGGRTACRRTGTRWSC